MYKLRCIAFVFVLTLLPAGSALGQSGRIIDVSVSGLDNSLLKNVLASLSLVREQNNERMNESMVRRIFDLADDEVKKALEPFGFYSPAIKKNMLSDGPAWKVQLEVSPGDPVRIAEVRIQLTGQGSDDPILQGYVSKFPLNIGDILDHQLYRQGKKELSAKVASEGYRDAVIVQKVIEVSRKNLAAKIVLSLDTGPLYFFGKTAFDADFLDKNLLYRMLPYSEGEPFSPKKIIKMRQAFLNSDYFSTVDVETGEPDSDSVDIPVSIRLKPKNPHRYELGIGYGTDTGFRGSVEWTNRMVNRYGHQLNLQLQPSERKSNFGAVYTIPIYDPKKDRLSLQGKWELENYDNTKAEARNIAVSYDHLGETGEYSFYLEFLDEDYEIGLETGHATLIKPGVRTTWRLADDRLKTKNGIRVTLNVTGANEDILSDVSFLQASLSSKAILTFYEKWRMIGRFQFGATLVDNVSDLPPSLRYYAGGDQSVRGFAYKSIGPTDSAGNVVGASHLFAYSLELERILFGNWSAALFFDSGDATNSMNELNMKNGAGIGLRWSAPFGQVRLDVANAVSEGKSSWRIHFNVGADL